MTIIKDSKFYSDIAKKRKNPYLPFKDKEYAKAMSKKAAEVRKQNKTKRERKRITL
jgi:hypothetical protein